jgi:hypothetical protein
MKNFLAQDITNPALGPTLQSYQRSEGGSAFFSAILPRAVALAFVIGALIFFFMLVWGAITWISSGGDKEKLASARGRITSAVVGLVLLFVALAIIQFIEKFFGINILTLDIGPLKI